MKRFFFVLLSLACALQSWAACDDLTFTGNGCFLEVRCVDGANTHIEANFHLNTLTYVEKNSGRFELRDGVGTTFTAKIDEVGAFGTLAAFFAFLDPLRAACQAAGGTTNLTANTSTVQLIKKCDVNGGTTTEFWYRHVYDGGGVLQSSVTVDKNGAAYAITGTEENCTTGGATGDTYDIELIKKCDDQGGGTIVEFYYQNLYTNGVFTSSTVVNTSGVAYVIVGTETACSISTTSVQRDVERVPVCDVETDGTVTTAFRDNIYNVEDGVLVSTSLVDQLGAAYTLQGTEQNCNDVCQSNNIPGFTTIINGTFTFPTNTYSSISYVIYGGSAVVTVGAGTPVTESVGDPGSTWNAQECKYLQLPITIDATGGGTVKVNYIQ